MQELISRSEALAQGLPHYNRCRPCRHGCGQLRYAANGHCVSCNNKRTLEDRLANPALHVRYTGAWQARNRERYLAGQRHYRQNNKGVVNAKQARRRAAKLNATPAWLTSEQLAQIRWFYDNCPEGWEVDHIIPLQGENVCGLHVPWNLQHLPAPVNRSKGNRL